MSQDLEMASLSQLESAYESLDLEAFTMSCRAWERSGPDRGVDLAFTSMLDRASRELDRAEYVRALLDVGADPNRVNHEGKAPLHVAAEVGNAAALEGLLQAEATNVNIPDDEGCTALHYAAMMGREVEVDQSERASEGEFVRCVQLLMRHPDVDLNKRNHKGYTPFHLAAIHGFRSIVRTMLVMTPERLNVDIKDGEGETARKLVEDKFLNDRDLVQRLPARTDKSPDTDANALFSLLHCRETELFLKELSQRERGADDMQDDSEHSELRSLPRSLQHPTPTSATETAGGWFRTRGGGATPHERGADDLQDDSEHSELRSLPRSLREHPTRATVTADRFRSRGGSGVPSQFRTVVPSFPSRALFHESERDREASRSPSHSWGMTRGTIWNLPADQRGPALGISQLNKAFERAGGDSCSASESGENRLRSAPRSITLKRGKESETYSDAPARLNDLDADDGYNTLLQLASQGGLYEVVRELLKRGADPNRTTPRNSLGPLSLACQSLHATVKGSVDSAGPGHAASRAGRAGRDHRKCVQALLKNKNVDVNAVDDTGSTALHYAERSGNSDVVVELLRAGACIGGDGRYDDPDDRTPLHDVLPSALETYLDECVVTNKLLPNQVIFKYDFLLGVPHAPHQRLSNNNNNNKNRSAAAAKLLKGKPGKPGPPTSEIPEMAPLLYMSQSEDLRYLLQHPIIKSFMQLKWKQIRAFYFANLAVYCVFCLLLTTHVYMLTDYSERTNRNETNGPGQWNAFADDAFSGIVSCMLAVFLGLLLLRELFQMTVSPLKYFLSPENWMELTLIVVVSAVLLTTGSWRQQLSAIAILMAGAELVLLMGRHPRLATNIKMFREVSINFFKFLSCYSILIVAFAFSFYILFHDCGGDTDACNSDDDDGDKFFLSPQMSVFKSIVMMTGEFDAGSIPFTSSPVTSHLLFILFVFLVTIVLFNLLNGLAVGDTQTIQKDAELWADVSRVRLVASLESMFPSRVNLYPYVDRHIHVHVHSKRAGKFSKRDDCSYSSRNDNAPPSSSPLEKEDFSLCAYVCGDISIVRDAKEVIRKRESQDAQTELSHIRDQVQRMNRNYKRDIQQIKDLLIELKAEKVRA